MGTRDCVFPRTKRELKAKRGGVLGREERGGQPFASFFCFLFLFFLLFFFFFSFFSYSVFSTKRNETKRNEAIRELFFLYERFGMS